MGRFIVLDWTDTNNWACLVDPMLYPIIMMSYRFGGRRRNLLRRNPNAGLMFSNDVLPIKIRYCFAYGVATFRGLGQANVT